MEAAENNRNPGMVRVLLSAGADLAARDGDFSMTPLMFAAWANESAAVIRALLAAGADVHARDRDGWTALMHAAVYNIHQDSPAVVGALLAAGSELDAVDDVEGYTALMWAANHGEVPAVVHALLDAGADPSVRGTNGETAATLMATNEPLRRTSAYLRLNQNPLIDYLAVTTRRRRRDRCQRCRRTGPRPGCRHRRSGRPALPSRRRSAPVRTPALAPETACDHATCDPDWSQRSFRHGCQRRYRAALVASSRTRSSSSSSGSSVRLISRSPGQRTVQVAGVGQLAARAARRRGRRPPRRSRLPTADGHPASVVRPREPTILGSTATPGQRR